MKVSYRGIQKDLPAKLQQKLDGRFAKLSRLVDGRGEKQAHVAVTTERHLHKCEITVRVHDRQLAGIGSDPDLFTALSEALDKIEKQALNQGEKWRATTRRSEPMKTAAAKAAPPPPVAATKKSSRKAAAAAGVAPRVFHANHHERRKPITLEEALLQMEDGRDYLVYRDADKQSVFMLVRRRDGHFDLIES
jgi:putative sigma-54 modulation protein